jgi:sulfopyruvate decarboxylase subunit beta
VDILTISDEIITLLKDEGVNFFATYPCAKFQVLYNLVQTNFLSIGVTKEEEGVGICAGASLTGAKPAMLIQSTGLGNMINALCSLTITYQLPLLVLASWRGVYKEKIVAQNHLGKSLPKILEAIGIEYHIIKTRQDLPKFRKALKATYSQNSLQVVLFSPQFWEEEPIPDSYQKDSPSVGCIQEAILPPAEGLLTRNEILETLTSYISDKIVVSNIGFPSRELYQVNHQSTNFYMLGSLGLASSIGLGIALFSKREVFVVDGDGSLLSNLGVLASIAQVNPSNLTILAVDNSAHGSTGNQVTPTATCVDLALSARSLGINNVTRVASRKDIVEAISNLGEGSNFVHIIARVGNAQVPPIPLTPIEIKQQFMQAIR